MAQYASAEQLLALSLTPAAYGRFTAEGTSLASVNAQLQAASGIANDWISSQFVMPLTQWGMSLTKAVCDIAAYELFIQFGFNPNALADKNIETRYKSAMEWLYKISRKEIRLDSNPDYIDSSAGIPAAGPMVISNLPIGFGTRAAFQGGGGRNE